MMIVGTGALMVGFRVTHPKSHGLCCHGQANRVNHRLKGNTKPLRPKAPRLYASALNPSPEPPKLSPSKPYKPKSQDLSWAAKVPAYHREEGLVYVDGTTCFGSLCEGLLLQFVLVDFMTCLMGMILNPTLLNP